MKKPQPTAHLTAQDLSVLVLCAFRYCLGRQTYMPGLFTGITQDRLGALDTNTLKLMCREITAEEERGYLGADCDVDTWRSFRATIIEEINKREEA